MLNRSVCACIQLRERERARASATTRTPETERKQNCKNSRDARNCFRGGERCRGTDDECNYFNSTYKKKKISWLAAIQCQVTNI